MHIADKLLSEGCACAMAETSGMFSHSYSYLLYSMPYCSILLLYKELVNIQLLSFFLSCYFLLPLIIEN